MGEDGFLIMIKKKCFLAVLVTLLFIFGGCYQPQKSSPPAEKKPEGVRIALAGDLLMHMPVVNSARETDTGQYNFGEIFNEISPYLSDPDFTVANLETRLAGTQKGFSGYPRFNTPEELAGDMKNVGIDLVTTANNHSMDMGRDGVLKTLDALDRAGLYYTGTYRSPAERDTPTFFDINGIKVGFINYTQDTNGLPVPSNASYMVNLIKRDRMLKEVKSLKEKGCQVIIAVIHAGTEYQRHPNEFQKAVAKDLFDAGVDVVTGSHPHVVQPLEWQTRVADGHEKRVLAAHSLGNFISNQRWRHSDCGIILNLDIVKNKDGTATLAGANYIPVWVDTYVMDGRVKYRVLPVNEALHNYETRSDPLLTEEDYKTMQQVWQDITGLIGPEFTPGP